MRFVLGGIMSAILGSCFILFGYELAILFLYCAGVSYIRSQNPDTHTVWRKVAYVLLGVACGVMSIVYSHNQYAERQNKVLDCAYPCAFQGTVVSRVDPGERYDTYEVKLTNIQTENVRNTFIKVQVPRTFAFSYGDSISFSGRGEPFLPFLSDTGRKVAYDEMMRTQHVHARVVAEDVQKTGSVSSMIAMSMWSTDMLASSLNAVLSEPYAGLGKGIVFGISDVLDDETEDLFRVTGLSHITVFSGANVAFILSIVWIVTGRLSFGLRILASLGVLLFVIAGVGFSPPTLRAGLMGGLFVIARAVGKNAAGLDVLFFSLICMLMYEPGLVLYDVSFQLSVLAVLALMTIAEPIAHACKVYMHPILAEVCSCTLAVSILVSPWIAYVFGTFSLSSFVTNVCVVPLVPLALVMTLLTSIAGVILPNVQLLVAIPTELILRGIYMIARIAAYIPYSSFTIQSFHGLILVCWYSLVCLFYMHYRYRVSTRGSVSQ